MSTLVLPSHDGDLKVKPEYLVAEEKKDREENGTVPAKGDKKQKQRGRNKDRPPPVTFSRGDRLCPIFVDVSPDRESWPQCTYKGDCAFQHDVDKYLESKQPDLGDECFIFKSYGRCNRGVTCRFARSHIVRDEANRVRNKVDRDLANKLGSLKLREFNHLEKDLQINLRKQQYIFEKSDEKVDSLFKLREASVKDKNSNSNNSATPPNKKVKLDEILGEVWAEVHHSKTLESYTLTRNGSAPDADIKMELNEAQHEIKDSVLTPKENNEATPAQVAQLDENQPKHLDFQSKEFKNIEWKDKTYLAPLTTVGNMPFRRICKEFGVDITCGEMAMSVQLLQAHPPEWALVQRHHSEDIFGIQLCGSSPHQLTRIAQLVEDGHISCDFIDLNLGCPIDLVYKKGMGSGMMNRKKPLEVMVLAMSSVMTRPLTLKMRSGIQMDKKLAHTLVPCLKEWGISMMTIHGRSREQRYTKLADWDYINQCSQIAKPIPIFGNGDIINYEDYNKLKEGAQVDGIMVARGALIKPWIFTEIKEQRHWDISAQERLDMIKRFANYGMEHWGSDEKGVEASRRFLLEWLSFLHRYVPVGLLEVPPQRMNDRVPSYKGRSDLETLLSSPACTDWIKITEMFLGKVPDNFAFVPKHKAHGY